MKYTVTYYDKIMHSWRSRDFDDRLKAIEFLTLRSKNEHLFNYFRLSHKE